jgi:hypothetical protein
MMGVCICCARRSNIQKHHPGRRCHSQREKCSPDCLTVPVCPSCHTILTIWDSGKHGERHWKPAATQGAKLTVGVADVLKLICLRNGLPTDSVNDVINSYRDSFRYRPSASPVGRDIDVIRAADRTAQFNEIRVMMGGYQRCKTMSS